MKKCLLYSFALFGVIVYFLMILNALGIGHFGMLYSSKPITCIKGVVP